MRKSLIFLSVLITAVAFGQTRDTAAIFGGISDTQGAAIPGASVTLTSSGTGQARKVVANESGQYLFPSLPIGTKEFSVNGSRNNNVHFSLDGGANMDNLMNTNLPFPFPDALEEFSVETSNMSLDQGNSSAGAVNVVTKAGTNKIHGDAFWFIRNTQLNASNFFSRQQDQLKRNQTGFTLGGPLRRNKLFAFGGYQQLWIRTASGATRVQTLTAAERQGDFSSNPITIYDPQSGQPFPRNTIPQNRLSPGALKLLAVSPLPDPDGFTRFPLSTPAIG